MIKQLLHQIIQTKYFNRWVIFFSDLFFSICCTLFSLFITSRLLISEYQLTDILYNKILFTIFVLSALSGALSFFCLQTYKGIIRHASFIEAGRLGIAALIKVILLILSVYLITGIRNIDILFISGLFDLLFTFFILIFIRVILISTFNYILNNVLNGFQDKENLLIFDSGLKSFAILGTYLSNLEQTYRVKGFIRFGSGNQLRINNQTVYSIYDHKSFNRLINRFFIKAILFPDDKTVRKESERFVRFCEKKKVRMLIMPKIDEIKDHKIKYCNLPEVRIEDLLNREEIKIKMTDIAVSLKEKVVLVTGAAGSIGSELCRQLCRFKLKELILLDNAETPMYNINLEITENFPDKQCTAVLGDVRNHNKMENVFKKFHPDVVFHAAAYKHVPIMEEHPCEAVVTNVCGTMTVADMAVKYGTDKFIMISSDKAVNPSNVMGASKRLAEIYVQSLGLAIAKGEYVGKTRFVTTRFGNVLGSNGSVIPRFHAQLAKGGPITVTHPDIIRYFMTIPEACRLVLEAACMGAENEIYVFDMGTPVKIADMARRMIELAGFGPGKDIEIEYTGLRPGEKLYEELLATKENTLPTYNEKIFRAQVQGYEYKQILPQMKELCETAKNIDLMETVRLMKTIVPEFKSQQSFYECLDKQIITNENNYQATEVAISNFLKKKKRSS